jgi:hypothetical protein
MLFIIGGGGIFNCGGCILFIIGGGGVELFCPFSICIKGGMGMLDFIGGSGI